jgi:hypothetical protein
MQQTLSLCIIMAINDGMSSIAFPLVGVNNLRYDASEIATCFMKAKLAAKRPIDVSITADAPRFNPAHGFTRLPSCGVCFVTVRSKGCLALAICAD